MHVHTHVHVWVCARARAHMCVHACKDVYMCMCVHSVCMQVQAKFSKSVLQTFECLHHCIINMLVLTSTGFCDG